MSKQNCWQVLNCGREPGGNNANISGVCPAAINAGKEGVNHGLCAGRYCWRVAGTLCQGRTQGTYAEKIESCINCRFFQQVQDEEGPCFLM